MTTTRTPTRTPTQAHTAHVEPLESYEPQRHKARWMISIAAAAALVAVVALSAIDDTSGGEPVQPAPTTVPTVTMTMDEKLQDLVDKGLIPAEALQPATRTLDEELHDLVDKGLIPRQALEPAPSGS